MRVCSTPGCPTVYAGTDSRCTAHQREARAKRIDNRVYSSGGHRRFRDAVLRRDPLCVVDYLAQSTVADHYPHSRIELIEMGLDPNDPQYGRGLCKKHHDQSTAEMYPSGWNAR